jgi:hypothetical protein
MNRLLQSKRVWIITLVFLLLAAGIAYADYTMPDGSVVRWVEGDTIEVINPDGSSHTTTGERNENGRLVPSDGSVDNDVADRLPEFNEEQRDGMDNTNMTVPIIIDGELSGWGDIYGEGHTYQDDSRVRRDHESDGQIVDWDPTNRTGGGVVRITTPDTSPDTPNSSQGSNDSNNSNDNNNNDSYDPPYTPPAPYVISVSVSGPSSATAAQSYSYTATATYNNGNTVDVTGSASWSNGPTFTPQDEGTYTVTARYKGATGSKQVTVTLPPAPTPPDKPPVRLY